jgi:hypothetical protein
MPEPLRQLVELAEARPFASIGCAIAAILYLRLMTSGPRVY